MFSSLSKTTAKQIQPPIESLHKQSKQIREEEAVNEEENRELHRTLEVYEQMMASMEAKIASLIEDGLIKMSEADVECCNFSTN